MDLKKLEKKSAQNRLKVLDKVMQAGRGHLGGTFSCIEILTCLYYEVLNLSLIKSRELLKNNQMISFEINEQIRDFLSGNYNELIIFCPFISYKGIRKCFEYISSPERKKIIIITRWRKLDIISGVSDIRIYPFLKAKGVKIYHNDLIHLKIFIKNKTECLFGSANITETAMGIRSISNIELIKQDTIDISFYSKFDEILINSVPIDDNFYKKMQEIKSENIDFYNNVKNLKANYLNNIELYNFLSPTYNREEYFKRWDI